MSGKEEEDEERKKKDWKNKWTNLLLDHYFARRFVCIYSFKCETDGERQK